MKAPKITKECVKTVLENRFLKVFDLQYEEGKHYFVASRRPFENMVAAKTKEEYDVMLPDAVSCVVVVELPDKEPQLLLSYEFRYPTGGFLLGVPAGLLDPEDAAEEKPLVATAIREIHEETGIVVDLKRDEVSVINPLLFSTPGMTDESNALILVKLRLESLDCLTQAGALEQECFDGFKLVSKDEAKELLKACKDEHGRFYSMYTWAALMYFVTDMWK